MAIGSGLAAQFGVSAESTFGTYVAPLGFSRSQRSTSRRSRRPCRGGGLPPVGSGDGRAPRRDVPGWHGLGYDGGDDDQARVAAAAPHGHHGHAGAAGRHPAYLQTHAAADNVGKYLTVQGGVPNTAGTVVPYSATGCKITSAEFSCGVDETLSVKLDMDARQVVDTQSPPPRRTPRHRCHSTSARWPSRSARRPALPRRWTGSARVTLKIDRPQRTDRFYAGAGGSRQSRL